MQLSSSFAQLITPSPTKFLKPIKVELHDKNIHFIDFSDGEPDVPIPEPVATVLLKSVMQGHYKYSSPTGSSELIETIGSINHIDHDRIFIGQGVKNMFYALIQTTCNPGDSIIILSPSWQTYQQQATTLNMSVYPFSVDQDTFLPNLQHLEILIKSTKKLRLLVFSNPNNPTGVIYPKELITQLMELANKYQFLLVIDEVFKDLVFTNDKIPLYSDYPEELQKNLILITSGSKSFGMTGFRVGYLLGPTEIVNNLSKYTTLTLTSIPEFIQDAYNTALMDQELLQYNRNRISNKYRAILRAIERSQNLRMTPSGGGICIFPKIISTYSNEWQLAEELLRNGHVATVPGIAFSYPGYLRLNFAHLTEQEISDGVYKIDTFLTNFI